MYVQTMLVYLSFKSLIINAFRQVFFGVDIDVAYAVPTGH